MSAEPGRARIHVWIEGRVQGVGFRYTTVQQAERLGLGGWVRNVGHDRVEAVFEGPAAEVAQAVAWCRRGPPDAWVSSVRSEPEPLRSETGFQARESVRRVDRS